MAEQNQQPEKRGRGRPRKHPLPEGYVPPPPKPKKTKTVPVEDLDSQRAAEPEPEPEPEPARVTASGRPARRTTRITDYAKIVNFTVAGDDEDENTIIGTKIREDADEDAEFEIGNEPELADEEGDDDLEVFESESDSGKTDINKDNEALNKSKKSKPKSAKRASTSVPAPNSRRTKESMEGKMELYFGHKSSLLVEAIEYRNNWVNELTSIRTHMLHEAFLSLEVSDFDLRQTTTIVDEEYAQSYLPGGRSSLNVDIGVDQKDFQEFRLNRLDVKRLEDVTDGHRKGYLIHSGGYVTSSEWAPLPHSEVQYLAISAAEADNLKLSLFESAEYKSSITIWQLNTTTGEFKLYSVLLHSWGVAWSLQWCPFDTRGLNLVGIVAAAFQDGKIRAIEVHANPISGPAYVKIERPTREWRLPGTMPSAVKWIDSQNLAVGTTAGFVTIFDLHADGPVVSSPVSHSAILSLQSLAPKYPYMVVVTTADGYARVLDYRDPRSCWASSSRAKGFSTVSAFIPGLNAVAVVEDGTQTKLKAVLSLSSETVFTHRDASVTCMASGQCHPFVAVGYADGSVVYGNSVARLLTNRKHVYRNWPQIRLWQLEYSEKADKYRFVDNIVAEEINSAIRASYRIFPSNIAITSLSWCSRKESGGWIAAGTANGMLRIENLAV
ncbi:WD40-repeat-containing domain protein [Lipomyces arxii]|uniref:WD40-repeat-containing domain protein n=1 Tax=Lipomyces arxii TaxID=56418 RepID=UPI0034CEE713